MQYGAHIYIFTDRWADDQLHLLDTMHGLGLDLAELSVGDDVHFTPARTRQRAQELGLTLTVGPGGAWPLPCDLSADDPAERAAGLAWHQRQVDLAAELGQWPMPARSMATPAWSSGGAHLPANTRGRQRGCTPWLSMRRRNVRIVLEPMSHFRTHLVNTARQLMELIDLADHPNLWALFDTYHLITEERDYAAAIRTLAPRLWCVHTCENDRGAPGGGLVPWASLFDSLCEVGFDGPLVMEAYNSSIGAAPGDFAYSRGMFHNVCPDGAEFVRTGLEFLRSQVASRWHS
jgi:D-psicose/D-tagatose/L-ribulose 3-epimerase